MKEHFETLFPGLQATQFHVTSPADRNYNCIGWAANDDCNWWWPVGDAPTIYWPLGAPREVSLDAFAKVFVMLGYDLIEGDHSLELGFEKIALFADAAGLPTHASRQLPSGKWTSKMGREVDIEHELQGLEGEIYGRVALILKRPRAPLSE